MPWMHVRIRTSPDQEILQEPRLHAVHLALRVHGAHLKRVDIDPAELKVQNRIDPVIQQARLEHQLMSTLVPYEAGRASTTRICICSP